jgi:hypothetical protein
LEVQEVNWKNRGSISGEAVQEGGQRHGGDLENAAGGRETFRKLNAPELLLEAAAGATYVNGKRVKNDNQRVPA